jgi:hypothetical protein
MQELINWLNGNTSFIQAITTLLLVVITAYYAWQTKRTVQIMSKTEEENKRPKVIVFITQREDWLNLVDLVIGNYGNGIARSISFKINDDLTLITKEQSLSKVEIIKNGLSTLAPQQVIKFPLLSLVGRVEDLQKKSLIISVEYKDHSQKHVYTESYPISFNSLVEQQLGNPPIYDIVKNMEGINKGVNEISHKIDSYRKPY